MYSVLGSAALSPFWTQPKLTQSDMVGDTGLFNDTEPIPSAFFPSFQIIQLLHKEQDPSQREAKFQEQSIMKVLLQPSALTHASIFFCTLLLLPCPLQKLE